MKKSLIISSTLLTLLGLTSTVLATISLLATLTSPTMLMFIGLFFAASLASLAPLLAGAFGLLSLKWPKLRNAALVFSLLFGVLCAMDLFSCFAHWSFSSFAGSAIRMALVVWFFLSALKAPD